MGLKLMVAAIAVIAAMTTDAYEEHLPGIVDASTVYNDQLRVAVAAERKRRQDARSGMIGRMELVLQDIVSTVLSEPLVNECYSGVMSDVNMRCADIGPQDHIVIGMRMLFCDARSSQSFPCKVARWCHFDKFDECVRQASESCVLHAKTHGQLSCATLQNAAFESRLHDMGERVATHLNGTAEALLDVSEGAAIAAAQTHALLAAVMDSVTAVRKEAAESMSGIAHNVTALRIDAASAASDAHEAVRALHDDLRTMETTLITRTRELMQDVIDNVTAVNRDALEALANASATIQQLETMTSAMRDRQSELSRVYLDLVATVGAIEGAVGQVDNRTRVMMDDLRRVKQTVGITSWIRDTILWVMIQSPATACAAGGGGVLIFVATLGRSLWQWAMSTRTNRSKRSTRQY